MTYSSYVKRKREEEKQRKEQKKIVMAAMVGAYNPREAMEAEAARTSGNVMKLFVKERGKKPVKECWPNINIKRIACGGFHCICYTQEKYIIGIGANHRGQLGMGHFDDMPKQHTKRPQRLRYKAFKRDPPVRIECGRETTYILTTKGKVYVMGGNKLYQLGQSHGEDICKPTLIDELAPITDIACGDEHALFYSSIKHLLYVCGSNSAGQLGLGTLNPYEKLSVHSFFGGQHGRKIKSMVCGSAHTIILTEAGELYGMGRSDEGALGSLIQIRDHDMPLVLKTAQIHPAKMLCDMHPSTPIVAIAAGWNHTLIVTEKSVFASGNNDHKQTNPTAKHDRLNTFTSISPSVLRHDDAHFVDLVATADNNSCLVANQRTIYTWGENFGSQCQVETLPKDAFIKQVGASYNKFFFVVEYNY